MRGLFSVVDELNIALFKDSNGIGALKLLTLQILFYPFIFLCTAIMQQEEQYSKLLAAVLGGVLVKVVLTGPLTQVRYFWNSHCISCFTGNDGTDKFMSV